MERYRRVDKRKQQEVLKENEIRITAQGLVRNYISYSLNVLQEGRAKEIVLKAMGQAISKAVGIAEIVKKRYPGLHQDTVISSTSITDVWEPVEEGLIPLEICRQVSLMSITLSMTDDQLNKNSTGYQAPPNKEQPKKQNQQTLVKHNDAHTRYEDGDAYVAGYYGNGGYGYTNGGRGNGWTNHGGTRSPVRGGAIGRGR